MRKLILIVSLLIITSRVYAAEKSKIELRGSVDDGTSTLQDTGPMVDYFTANARQNQLIQLPASSYTNIVVPLTADAVIIDVGTFTGLKLKGVTADTGISLDSSTPILLPLSRDNTVTLGIQNLRDQNANCRVWWF